MDRLMEWGGGISLDCQAAQEMTEMLSNPETIMEMSEARYRGLMRSMELHRAEDVREIMKSCGGQ